MTELFESLQETIQAPEQQIPTLGAVLVAKYPGRESGCGVFIPESCEPKRGSTINNALGGQAQPGAKELPARGTPRLIPYPPRVWFVPGPSHHGSRNTKVPIHDYKHPSGTLPLDG